MTVLKFRNIIVWPRIPRLTAGVKLHEQTSRDPAVNNIAILPVVRIERKKESKPEPSYNEIQKIISKTMRGQRYSKRSAGALEKLRKMWPDRA